MSRLRGRFSVPTDPEMDRFSTSIEIDLEMAQDDIRGSRAHAIMLGEAGLITPTEAESLVGGLDQIARELATGDFSPTAEHEDIHMAVEARLGELLGDLAGKLHTARSRNDQVATDVRLWLLRELNRLDDSLSDLIRTLLERVRADGRTLMPGYTHLQRGQPILLGHHLLGHAWPLWRDRQRLADARRRVDASPLGACALAGTGLPIDRHRTAEILGFAGLVENALDAVASRDHAQEVAAVCAIAMTHFSRMAAELVLWSSAEFHFVVIDQAYATGSSIMPQKRNPDSAELVRGKAARVYGDLITLLTLAKGLPLAYNRDLQEDRRPLFDAVETTTSSATILAGVWRTLVVDGGRFESELVGDDSLATDLADAMVGIGVPFRQAHERVGALLQTLESEGRRMDTIDMTDLQDHAIDIPGELFTGLLDPEQAVGRKTSRGGTSWTEIERQVQLLEESV